MGKQYITFHSVTMKTIISGLWRRFAAISRIPKWACRLQGFTTSASSPTDHSATASASYGKESCCERKQTGKHQGCCDADYRWVEANEKTRSFPPDTMNKFIEHRPSGDYWIKEMGGGRIS